MSEVLHPEPVTVEQDTPVREVARELADRNVGAAVVLDGGQLAGIVTERDLLRRVLAAELDPRAPVRDVMTVPVETTTPDAPISHVAQSMARGRYRHLPVVHQHRVVGMVTDRDILALSEPLFEKARIDVNGNANHLRRPDMGQCEGCEDVTDDLETIDGVHLCTECREDRTLVEIVS